MRKFINGVLKVASLLFGIFELIRFAITHDFKFLALSSLGLLMFVVFHCLIDRIIDWSTDEKTEPKRELPEQ